MFDKKTTRNSKRLLIAAAAGLTLTPLMAQTEASADELRALREQIGALEARLQELEAAAHDIPPAPEPTVEKRVADPSAVAVAVDTRGFTAQTTDKRYSFRIRPRFQVDARVFLDDTGRNEVVVRRLRPVFQGTAPRISWRFMPELASDVRILDAWIDLSLADDVLLRAGKFKGFIGLERLQSFSHTLFMERGLPTNLTPTREIGLELQGKLLEGTLGWSVGFYNGSLDDTDLALNQDPGSGDFDYGARLFWEPFKNAENSLLTGLGLGIAASRGSENVTIADADRDRRIRYRTSGRNTFFRYRDGVRIDGDRYRINPQLYYYNGPFGLLAEFVTSSYELGSGGVRQEVQSDGFTVQAGWVLTGEKASYDALRPARPFNPSSRSWGAFEIGVRYAELEVDEAAFAGGPSTSLAHSSAAQKAGSAAIGLNWRPADNLRFQINYEETDFSGPGANRPTEKVIMSRAQLDF